MANRLKDPTVTRGRRSALGVVLVLLAAACSKPLSVPRSHRDPLTVAAKRVWEVSPNVASDQERFEDMRRRVHWLAERHKLAEVLIRYGDGWIYGASGQGTCGVLAYLDASLVVRDVETFMAYMSLRVITPSEPDMPIQVIEDWHAGTGLDRLTLYEVTVTDNRIDSRRVRVLDYDSPFFSP